jgi:hypothetical protein
MLVSLCTIPLLSGGVGGAVCGGDERRNKLFSWKKTSWYSLLIQSKKMA